MNNHYALATLLVTTCIAGPVLGQVADVTDIQPAGCNNSGSATLNATYPGGGTWSLSVLDLNTTAVVFQLSLFNQSSTVQYVTGLAPGAYGAYVEGPNGNASDFFSIAAGPNVTATETHVDPIGGPTGSINVTPSGGTPPYSYLWSTGGTNEDITGLAPGTYTLTITDSKACTATLTVTLIDATAVPEVHGALVNVAVITDGYDDGRLTVLLDAARPSLAGIHLVDAHGRIIAHQASVGLSSGHNRIHLNTGSPLAEGAYVLMVTSAYDRPVQRRFVLAGR